MQMRYRSAFWRKLRTVAPGAYWWSDGFGVVDGLSCARRILLSLSRQRTLYLCPLATCQGTPVTAMCEFEQRVPHACLVVFGVYRLFNRYRLSGE